MEVRAFHFSTFYDIMHLCHIEESVMNKLEKTINLMKIYENQNRLYSNPNALFFSLHSFLCEYFAVSCLESVVNRAFNLALAIIMKNIYSFVYNRADISINYSLNI